MKKLNKVLLIISGICGGTGIVLFLAGILMGVSRHDILSSMSITVKDFGKRVGNIVTAEMDDTWKGDWEELDLNEWQVEQYKDIKELDINIDIGQLDIQEYNGEILQVFFRKEDHLTEVKQDGRELKIRQANGADLFSIDGNWPVKVMVPKGHEFTEVDIEIGAGEGSITSLKSDEMNGKVGAGSLEVTETVQAVTSEWSVGAGSLYLNHLISKETDLECAVGEIIATLDGEEADYCMKGDLGVGSLMFGEGEWMDSIGQKVEYGDDSAKRMVNVECGTGEVQVDFTE
ncbi:MAG: DUF4097 family beta strand repeat protein [Clostridiales bacterium]|nr:DUF4097 family beta strand repeat protein [Clostridiales bacterium]